MSYEMTGKVKVIQEPQTFASGFTKRELVVTVPDGKNGDYDQDICVEFLQDKCALVEALSIGQEVTVSFDIRGREYNGRYFNNLVAWKVEAGQGSPNTENDAQNANTGDSDDELAGLEDSSSIPF